MTPDLLYLETTWAALMSYGLTVKLLQDVLPAQCISCGTFVNGMRLSRPN